MARLPEPGVHMVVTASEIQTNYSRLLYCVVTFHIILATKPWNLCGTCKNHIDQFFAASGRPMTKQLVGSSRLAASLQALCHLIHVAKKEPQGGGLPIFSCVTRMILELVPANDVFSSREVQPWAKCGGNYLISGVHFLTSMLIRALLFN